MKSNLVFKNILIIGLGVMGGSYLKKIASSQVNIYAMEIDDNTKQLVNNDGYQVTYINYDDLEILKIIDLVIITLYPKYLIDCFNQLNNKLSNNALVIEVSGIKALNAQLLSTTSYHFNYLLVHPMAGRESGGYHFSDPNIFMNANHIIINNDLKQDIMDQYLAFSSFLGFNKPIFMDAYQHDQAITYTSQLAHVLAVSLINSSDYQSDTKLCIGDSFRDLTRIAKMNVPLWQALFSDNQILLSQSITALINELQTINDYIINDQDQLSTYLTKARLRRIEIENKE
ncbi:MAG: prephenate dehydrogenase [Bacilli bacterium]